MGFWTWLILSIIIGAYAGKKGRSPVNWFLLSMFLSPVVGGIGILVAKDHTKEFDYRETTITQIDPPKNIIINNNFNIPKNIPVHGAEPAKDNNIFISNQAPVQNNNYQMQQMNPNLMPENNGNKYFTNDNDPFRPTASNTPMSQQPAPAADYNNVSYPQPAPVYPQPVSAERSFKKKEEALYCPGCGNEITEGTKVCPHCSTTLKKTCQNCGQEVDFDVKFCPVCGTFIEKR